MLNKAKSIAYFVAFLVLSGSIILCVGPIGGSKSTPAQFSNPISIDNLEGYHECRMWGMITPTLPETVVINHLVDYSHSIKNLGGGPLGPGNDDGWGMIYYSSGTPIEARGAPPAYEDSNFNTAAMALASSGKQIAMAHVRNRATGATGIPDPHPFIRDRGGKNWTLEQNGSLDKALLKSLIGPTYLNQFTPPSYAPTGWDDPNVVDTDLYLIYILKCIEGSNLDVKTGIALAEATLNDHAGYTPGKNGNFILSDGTFMWGFRKATDGIHTLYYKYNSSPIHSAIVSEPPEGTQGSWITMNDWNLVELSVNYPPVLIPDIRTYANPVVRYVDVWSYPDNNWVPQGGTVIQGRTARIYAGISNPVAPVSISYGPSGGSLTKVTASYESTWDYYYVDWVIPLGATLGVYDVKVESGVTSTTATGRFQVGAPAPVVNYVDVWSYPDNNWVSQGGAVIQGNTARIYAGISNPVVPVSFSFRLQGGSWITVTASYESTWDYYYIDWATSYGAAIGVYDVKVESGVTSTTASGRFQVGASAPVVKYIDAWSYPDNSYIAQGGTVTREHVVRIYAGISNPVELVSISYGLSGGSLSKVTALYESTWDYYYVDWAIPSDAALGFYDVRVETGEVDGDTVGRFKVGAAAPVVRYVDVWSYPDNNWVPQGGTVTRGRTARIYAGVSDPGASVEIGYKLHSDSTWTTRSASYVEEWDYWYIDWAIPAGATLGLYDVKVDTGGVSTSAIGRFQVGS